MEILSMQLMEPDMDQELGAAFAPSSGGSSWSMCCGKSIE